MGDGTKIRAMDFRTKYDWLVASTGEPSDFINQVESDAFLTEVQKALQLTPPKELPKKLESMRDRSERDVHRNYRINGKKIAYQDIDTLPQHPLLREFIKHWYYQGISSVKAFSYLTVLLKRHGLLNDETPIPGDYDINIKLQDENTFYLEFVTRRYQPTQEAGYLEPYQAPEQKMVVQVSLDPKQAQAIADANLLHPSSRELINAVQLKIVMNEVIEEVGVPEYSEETYRALHYFIAQKVVKSEPLMSFEQAVIDRLEDKLDADLTANEQVLKASHNTTNAANILDQPTIIRLIHESTITGWAEFLSNKYQFDPVLGPRLNEVRRNKDDVAAAVGARNVSWFANQLLQPQSQMTLAWFSTYPENTLAAVLRTRVKGFKTLKSLMSNTQAFELSMNNHTAAVEMLNHNQWMFFRKPFTPDQLRQLVIRHPELRETHFKAPQPPVSFWTRFKSWVKGWFYHNYERELRMSGFTFPQPPAVENPKETAVKKLQQLKSEYADAMILVETQNYIISQNPDVTNGNMKVEWDEDQLRQVGTDLSGLEDTLKTGKLTEGAVQGVNRALDTLDSTMNGIKSQVNMTNMNLLVAFQERLNSQQAFPGKEDFIEIVDWFDVIEHGVTGRNGITPSFQDHLPEFAQDPQFIESLGNKCVERIIAGSHDRSLDLRQAIALTQRYFEQMAPKIYSRSGQPLSTFLSSINDQTLLRVLDDYVFDRIRDGNGTELPRATEVVQNALLNRLTVDTYWLMKALEAGAADKLKAVIREAGLPREEYSALVNKLRTTIRPTLVLPEQQASVDDFIEFLETSDHFPAMIGPVAEPAPELDETVLYRTMLELITPGENPLSNPQYESRARQCLCEPTQERALSIADRHPELLMKIMANPKCTHWHLYLGERAVMQKLLTQRPALNVQGGLLKEYFNLLIKIPKFCENFLRMALVDASSTIGTTNLTALALLNHPAHQDQAVAILSGGEPNLVKMVASQMTPEAFDRIIVNSAVFEKLINSIFESPGSELLARSAVLNKKVREYLKDHTEFSKQLLNQSSSKKILIEQGIIFEPAVLKGMLSIVNPLDTFLKSLPLDQFRANANECFDVFLTKPEFLPKFLSFCTLNAIPLKCQSEPELSRMLKILDKPSAILLAYSVEASQQAPAKAYVKEAIASLNIENLLKVFALSPIHCFNTMYSDPNLTDHLEACIKSATNETLLMLLKHLQNTDQVAYQWLFQVPSVQEKMKKAFSSEYLKELIGNNSAVYAAVKAVKPDLDNKLLSELNVTPLTELLTQHTHLVDVFMSPECQEARREFSSQAKLQHLSSIRAALLGKRENAKFDSGLFAFFCSSYIDSTTWRAFPDLLDLVIKGFAAEIEQNATQLSPGAKTKLLELLTLDVHTRSADLKQWFDENGTPLQKLMQRLMGGEQVTEEEFAVVGINNLFNKVSLLSDEAKMSLCRSEVFVEAVLEAIIKEPYKAGNLTQILGLSEFWETLIKKLPLVEQVIDLFTRHPIWGNPDEQLQLKQSTLVIDDHVYAYLARLLTRVSAERVDKFIKANQAFRDATVVLKNKCAVIDDMPGKKIPNLYDIALKYNVKSLIDYLERNKLVEIEAHSVMNRIIHCDSVDKIQAILENALYHQTLLNAVTNSSEQQWNIWLNSLLTRPAFLTWYDQPSNDRNLFKPAIEKMSGRTGNSAPSAELSIMSILQNQRQPVTSASGKPIVPKSEALKSDVSSEGTVVELHH